MNWQVLAGANVPQKSWGLKLTRVSFLKQTTIITKECVKYTKINCWEAKPET